MNALTPTSAAPSLLDESIEIVGGLYAFAFSYFGYAYFYFYLPAGDT
ncbi:hypothetical protein [Salinibacter sp. 10B]|nr:hypothetical protein [Salinibacter sp. 10B]